MSQPLPAPDPTIAAASLPENYSECANRETKPGKKEKGQFGYLWRVFQYADQKGTWMNVAAAACMIASGTALPLMDIIFGRFVTVFNDFVTGRMSSSEFRSEINLYTRYYLYLFVGKFVLTYAWTLLISISATRTTKALRIDFLRQTLRQEIAFFDSSTSSSIAAQVTTNGNIINQGISERLGLIVQSLSMFIAAFIVAFAIQWKLTLIIISIVPVNLGVTILCVFFDVLYENRIFKIYSQGSSLAEETFASIRTVHSFWMYPKLSAKFERIMEDARRVGMKKSPVYATLFCIEFFCIYAGYALAFWQGIRMFARGEIEEPGVIVTVIFAVIVAAQALTQVAPQSTHIAKSAAAAQELFQNIDRVSKIDALSDVGIIPQQIQGHIQLSNVHFSYPTRPDVPVLNDLSLSIPASKKTALVGASGSGKSTIVGLVERWYTPTRGCITLDGTAIEDLNIQWLRSSIRLVQQDPTLFGGTIFDNVAYGLTGTHMADVGPEQKARLVEDACKAAFAHEFVERLPQGYNTTIGERGSSLSGGQKQRIVIARSIISNPRVLLLDEATSALDPSAEKIVQKALNNASAGRTMVVIAHRLSTIRDADNIVVMSQGSIVEQGTHSELMDFRGAYFRLVQSQDLIQKHDRNADEEISDVEASYVKYDPISRQATAVSVQEEHEAETHADVEGGTRTAYSTAKCLWIIFKEQKELWLIWFWIMVGCVVAGGTYPAIAVLFSHTMEVFERPRDDMTSRGDFFALMFFVVSLGNLVAYAMLGFVGNRLAQIVTRNFRNEMFNLVMRQEMSYFDQPSNTAGALVSRLSSDPQNIQELVSMNIALLLINIINLGSSCILAIAVGWKLGLVLVFGALPPLVFCGYLRIRLEYKLDEENAARFADSSGLASEAVMAIRTVSSLTLEREVLERYVGSLQGISKKAIGSLGWRMLWYALSQSISFLAMALGFWYGGRLMSFGEYDSMQFYTVFIAVLFSGEAAAMFFQSSSSITKAKVSANYIFDLRRQLKESQRQDRHDASDDEEPKGRSGISCESLWFAYPQRPQLAVLKGISAKIEAGRFVAFVGASGCGKTTMINLLERFYDPSSGTINMGNRPICSIRKQSYRARLALVAQEPVLYQGSIRENIALGTNDSDPEAQPTEEQILEACESANIRTFIESLPDGLSTMCGTRGFQLSGGQRQRIAIARALVRQPKLLLLDEATSALDTESEAVVKRALDQAATGRTTISVAHRLSTIRDADVIFVFARGIIVESGRHEHLLQKRGVYYEMCLGQSLDREA